MTLAVNTPSRKIIEAHALGTFPNECCGFFFGQNSGTMRTVSEAYVVENTRQGDQRRRFEISPLDYMKAERYALDRRLDLLGVYHSHPLHPAIPSEHDLAVALPEFSYIIVSVNPNEVVEFRSWRLNDQRTFVEETVKNK